MANFFMHETDHAVAVRRSRADAAKSVVWTTPPETAMIVTVEHRRGDAPPDRPAARACGFLERSRATSVPRPAGWQRRVSQAAQNPEPILPRVAAGDEAAVKEVIREYGGLVWSLARRLCGNQSEAEEAVQEIFIDVWKSAARFDASIAAERTFIAMIARRRLIDRRRRLSRRPTMTSQVEAVSDAPPTGTDMETSEEARQAAEAFEQLRPEQREVLHMAIWRNMTHEQIASATGMPLGTVKTHARRGMIKVREILAKENEANAPAAPKGVSR